MQINNSMKELLKKYSIEDIEKIPQNKVYPIWEKRDSIGRTYWGVSTFWGLDENPMLHEQNLSQLEWDGNEVRLDTRKENKIPQILKDAIGILKFWKAELETRYSDMPFYMLASYDNGDMLILDEGELPNRSVTLRFWAYRGDNTIIDFSAFDEWDEPAIIDKCNFNAG